MASRMAAAGLCLMSLVVASCSNSEPNRLRVSGSATFDGKPIPFGQIVFTPDGAKRNSGPQGVAVIRAGKFDTAAEDGKGVAGGPTVISVTGLTAEGGKPLCDHELRIDLPRKDSLQDLEVPAKAAAKSRPDI